nr:uncharacterized protein LOC121128239 [Lepeophtheirus salmonis]
MKLLFVLLVSLLSVAVFLPQEGESAPRGGRGGGSRSRPRSGRQGYENGATEGNGAEQEEEEGPEHPWCDPKDPMGAWMNYINVRKWCAENGYTNFGPYGGVPSDDQEEA